MKRYKASLATLYPAIADEWHLTKNGDLTPDKITPGSVKKIWWKCPEGPDHEWPAPPANRTGRKSGCPYCAGKKASVTNSLASLYPDTAKQWHPEKNGKTTPDQVVAGSSKKYWWKCPEGPDHEWEATPYQRTQSGSGCHCCRGKKVSVTNSLATRFPEISAQWHPTKNGDLTPKDVTASSNKKVWWKCPKEPDHEWHVSVASRTTGEHGCPFCGRSGVKTRVAYSNSLAAKHPKIAAQWHSTMNGDLTPAGVLPGSGKSVWWKCPEGPDHEWPAKIYSRTTATIRSGCPCCAGRLVSVTNSLATQYPEIAKQWHPMRNGNVTPDQVPSGSSHRYSWKCPEGPDHEWDASPSARTVKPRKSGGKGRGCPFCANQRSSVTNSLLSLFPDVAAELHPEKNNGVTADKIIAGSTKKYCWRCTVNPKHEWDARPGDRTGPRKSGCPQCHVPQRSKVEIYLAFELAHFLGFDVNETKVMVDGEGWNVDIKIPDASLIIEFDGHFWHKNRRRRKQDIRKTTVLTNAGWTVLRLREEPLNPLSTNDIVVPQAYTKDVIKKVAILALQQVQKVTGSKIQGFAEYKRSEELVNSKPAKKYLKKLLERDEALKLESYSKLYEPFDVARNYVKLKQFKTVYEFREWAKSDKCPPDIPNNPEVIYKNSGFTDFNDFLGKETFLPFPDARDYLRSKGFRTVAEFRQWAKTDQRPPNIPSSPERYYKDCGFIDFYDLLGILKPPDLTIDIVMSWAEHLRKVTGQWPTSTSGEVIDAPNENWGALNAALEKGRRGLPENYSIAKLLEEQVGKRNPKGLPDLTEELILKLADKHYERIGEYPDTQLGKVVGLSGDTWRGINHALHRGGRGLPGGDSLLKLLKRHGRKRKIRRTSRATLTEDMIWVWMKAHHAKTGKWPSAAAGEVLDVGGETWGGLNTCLREGLRGLSGEPSLKKLREKRLSLKGHCPAKRQ